MSELYSIVIKASDGTVAVKAFDRLHTNIAIASRGKFASVFTESLPEELQPFKHDSAELIARVRNILNDNTIQVRVRSMMSVHINDDGNYEMVLDNKRAVLDGDHPELASRLVATKTRNSSANGGRTEKTARLFGKRV